MTEAAGCLGPKARERRERELSLACDEMVGVLIVLAVSGVHRTVKLGYTLLNLCSLCYINFFSTELIREGIHQNLNNKVHFFTYNKCKFILGNMIMDLFLNPLGKMICASIVL